MSPEMSLPTATIKRLPTIKQGLLSGDSHEQMATKLGVNEKTIDRDFAKWVNSGEFEEWIKEEWLRLHHQTIHDNPELAYVQISRLVGHMLTRRIERKEQIEVSEQVVTVNVTENEDEILSKATAILARKDRFNPLH